MKLLLFNLLLFFGIFASAEVVPAQAQIDCFVGEVALKDLSLKMKEKETADVVINLDYPLNANVRGFSKYKGVPVDGTFSIKETFVTQFSDNLQLFREINKDSWTYLIIGLYPEVSYPTMFFKVELQILDNFVTDTTGSYLLTQTKMYSCGLQNDAFWNEPWFIPNPSN